MFRLLREYLRNIVDTGFTEARWLLSEASVSEGRQWALGVMWLTDSTAQHWCEKALTKVL